MEHREAPRGAEARRFARFGAAPAGPRRSLGRPGLAGLAGLLAVGVVAAGGWYTLGALGGWVPRQRPYQIAFDEITLEPPPPAWYRGGSRAFLDRVRRAALIREERLSVLDCDLEKLRVDFQKYAWVKRVIRVRRAPPDRTSPARLTVQLEYPEPVAAVVLPRSPEVVLDGEGVILPGEDLDRERAGPLIPIHHLDPPYLPRAGQVWKRDGEPPGVAQVNPRAVAAARLAAFLRSVAARQEASGPLSRMPLIAFNMNGAGPFITFDVAEKRWLLWPEVPGDESPGQLKAEAKWALLHDWVQKNGLEAWKPSPYYLEFAREGLVLRRGHVRPSDGD